MIPTITTVATESSSVRLADEQGTIPLFGPRASDANGRPIPISDEQRALRRASALRTLRALAAIETEGEGELDDLMEIGMREIDAERPPGQKLFERLA